MSCDDSDLIQSVQKDKSFPEKEVVYAGHESERYPCSHPFTSVPVGREIQCEGSKLKRNDYFRKIGLLCARPNFFSLIFRSSKAYDRLEKCAHVNVARVNAVLGYLPVQTAGSAAAAGR